MGDGRETPKLTFTLKRPVVAVGGREGRREARERWWDGEAFARG